MKIFFLALLFYTMALNAKDITIIGHITQAEDKSYEIEGLIYPEKRAIKVKLEGNRIFSLADAKESGVYKIVGDYQSRRLSSVLKIEHFSKIETKIKAKKYENNITLAKVLIKSSMYTPNEILKRRVHTDRVIHIQAFADAQLVFDFYPSYYVSKNPLMKFKYRDINASILKLWYKDNIGYEVSKNREIRFKKSAYTLKLPPLEPMKYKEKTVKIAEIKKQFGTEKFYEGGIELTAPTLASNGGAIPINIRSSLDIIELYLFAEYYNEGVQYICKWKSTPYSIIDYDIKIKMNTGWYDENNKRIDNLYVVAKSKDGKFYFTSTYVEVAVAGGN